MAERLVILSDMHGSKRGMWITSYLGYLQQYFDIEFYDSTQLANIDITVNTDENVYKDFVEGGLDTAVAHLMKIERVDSHYLAFCAGGTIAWKAGLMGLPMKSLYAVSALNLENFDWKPECPVHLLYGEYGDYKRNLPGDDWANKVSANLEVMPKYGGDLYSDELIIQKVCLNLLESMLKKKHQPLRNSL